MITYAKLNYKTRETNAMETIVLTLETLQENGITSLIKIDDKYCEITSNNKTALRNYYLNNKGAGHFYLKDTRYTIHHFLDTVPNGKTSNEAELERARKSSENMKDTGAKVEVDFTKPSKVPEIAKNGIVKHYQHEIIKTCIHQDIPAYLCGEAGTGKNFTLQAIAEELEMEFYFTNSVQQEYKITGFIDAGGIYHETEFYKAFKDGGLFFLDEIDASIPEVLVLLNAAIANRYFEFPNGKITAHKDFRVVAAGNTVGTGANELYTGRLVLDSATLDRFVVIEFGYDKNIELNLAKGNETLVNFIRGLREFSVRNGIRATFSYRCIMSVVKLEAAGLPLKQILQIAVFKGMDKDTIRTMKVYNSGKYFRAMRELTHIIT